MSRLDTRRRLRLAPLNFLKRGLLGSDKANGLRLNGGLLQVGNGIKSRNLARYGLRYQGGAELRWGITGSMITGPSSVQDVARDHGQPLG